MSKAYTTGMKDTSNKHTNEILSEDQENGFKKETDKHENSLEREKAFDLVKNAYENILIGLGLDPTSESLRKTPARAANALLGFAKGYRETVKEVVKGAIYDVGSNNMVIVRNIEVHSMCEHHMFPFHGKVSIGYVPNKKVIGLSKLVRIVEMFSRRLQRFVSPTLLFAFSKPSKHLQMMQEQLTDQIAEAVVDAIKPAGVAVIMEATHMCMVMRGVERSATSTITSCMLGVLLDDPARRHEFLTLIQ